MKFKDLDLTEFNVVQVSVKVFVIEDLSFTEFNCSGPRLIWKSKLLSATSYLCLGYFVSKAPFMSLKLKRRTVDVSTIYSEI